MLSSVNVYSSWLGAANLAASGFGIEKDLIQIRNITGLGPVKATINTTPFGSVDGETYIGSVVPKREIVLTLGLNPDWATWSMEKLRRVVYSYFMPKQRVRLVFYSDDDFPTVDIFGYTESIEPTMFSKDGELQVVVICPEPHFKAVNPTVLTGVNNVVTMINYNGSVPTGIYVKAIQNPYPNPIPNQIVVTANSLTPALRVATAFTPLAYFEMSSIGGDKYARFVSATGTGVITNLLPAITSVGWPILIPGPNDFSLKTDGGAQTWMLMYYERFGGL